MGYGRRSCGISMGAFGCLLSFPIQYNSDRQFPAAFFSMHT